MHVDPTPETVLSARPDELVLMLFQAAAKFGHQTIAQMDADRDAEAAESLGRVRAILIELDRAVNVDAGAMGRHLAAIYEYLMRRICAPEVSREDVVEVVSDMESLGAAWADLVAQRSAELAAV